MTTATQTPLTPLPNNIEILNDRDSLIIRRKWFSCVAIFLAVFALFWNGFMVVWMTLALSSGALGMAAFGSIHAMVGIFLAYFCIASFINKTDLIIDPNHLRVRHYPLPWRGNKKIRVHTIQQIYTREHVSQTRNSVNTTYPLYVITDDNREQKLLSGLVEVSQARFIEQEIENILGLQDRPVTGEFRK